MHCNDTEILNLLDKLKLFKMMQKPWPMIPTSNGKN